MPDPGTAWTRSPLASKVAVSVRPIGDCVVTVRVAASYVDCQMSPLFVCESSILTTLRGSAWLASWAVRSYVNVWVRPPGVLRTSFVTIGASIPKRGSGPPTAVTFIPSAVVIVEAPSCPVTETLIAPVADVNVVFTSPFGRCSTSYVVARPLGAVRVTL
jgi:hypothetical protein